MSRTRNRVTKTSLTLLWLLSSSEIFGCCKRIESTSAGMHRQGIHRHHHHHDREVRAFVSPSCVSVYLGGASGFSQPFSIEGTRRRRVAHSTPYTFMQPAKRAESTRPRAARNPKTDHEYVHTLINHRLDATGPSGPAEQPLREARFLGRGRGSQRGCGSGRRIAARPQTPAMSCTAAVVRVFLLCLSGVGLGRIVRSASRV